MTDATATEPQESPVPSTPVPLDTGTNESRLTELEQQVLAQFQGRETDDGDFDFDSIPSRGSDGDLPPATPTDEEAPHTSDDVEGDAGEGVGDGAVEATVPAPPPEPEYDDDAELVYVIGDEEYTEEQVQAGLEARTWIEGLDETQVQTIDAALSGDYVLVPMSDVPAITAYYEAQQNPSQPVQRAEMHNVYDDDEPADPRVAQLEAQVQQLTQAQERQQQQALYEQTRAQVAQGSETFWNENPDLDAKDRDRLASSVMSSGVYQQALGNGQTPEQAAYYALEAAKLADPILMQRTVDAQVASRLEAERAALAEQQRVTAGSTALAGSGASTAATPMPQSLDEQRVEMIRRAMEA